MGAIAEVDITKNLSISPPPVPVEEDPSGKDCLLFRFYVCFVMLRSIIYYAATYFASICSIPSARSPHGLVILWDIDGLIGRVRGRSTDKDLTIRKYVLTVLGVGKCRRIVWTLAWVSYSPCCGSLLSFSAFGQATTSRQPRTPVRLLVILDAVLIILVPVSPVTYLLGHCRNISIPITLLRVCGGPW